MTNDKNTGSDTASPVERVRNDWRVILEKLSYKAIVNNIPFLAYLAVICMLYISNSHKAIYMQRELNAKTKELKELRWKYMDVKSALMNTKTEKQVLVSAERIGLKASTTPAYKVNY